ncbi:MAG TPA: glycosyltransferase family 39 protein [Burkholderiaceae bacterium]|jgi:4-amino-4-deoxy-L-arabinose transferase-like glycosyltransferase|nr:glycosyltransferase family 39 protein [Burkholderiaceae bacterium]
MKPGRLLLCVLVVVVLARVASLALYPLTDTTEARYGEIGRKMLETGDWITPQWDYGVPFWGKPPLSFWAAAATMAVFGVNEFGARIATLIAALATAALFWRWPHAPAPRGAASMAAALVLLSSVLGFLMMGAVATDVFMTFGMTLSMIAFWNAVSRGAPGGSDRWWFFVGLAVGLLAKGPVALVVTGIALFLWLLWTRDWRRMWRQLPWAGGIALTLALALPWYLAAERATPGFLHYFIIGEHWQRFTQPGWTGDLYGGGHERPRGAIWLYAFGSALPWSIVALVLLRRKPVSGQASRPSPDPQIAYLLCWVLAPLVLFTLARNILESYALPALPAFALIAARLLMERERGGAASRVWLLGLVMPVVVAGLIASGHERFSDALSQRVLLAPLRNSKLPIVYLYERPFSGQFYSGGRALLVKEQPEIERWLATDQPAIVLLPQGRFDAIGLAADPRWKVAGRHEGFVMLERRAAH